MFRRGLSRGKGSGADQKKNEPEYEEISFPPSISTNKKNEENTPKRGDGHHCDLCGSSEAAVRCDKCGSQAFCLSCDDMYHKHPRRSTHIRKAVDSMNPGSGVVRPPLPPKGEGQGAPPPQPPPRKNKRGILVNKRDQNYQYSSGSAQPTYRSTSMTNLQNGPVTDADGGSRYSLALPIRKPSSATSEVGSASRTIMGSLKRFMGARPLPPTPDQPKGNFKNDRSSKHVMRANTSPSLPNLSDPLPDDDEIRSGLPQSVLEINRTPAHRPPNNSTSTPVTPASAHAQYPPLQPKRPASSAQTNTHSLGRKFSLQQQIASGNFDDKRTSMVEANSGANPWETEAPKPAIRNRSQSVSDDQWAQMMAAQIASTNADGSLGPTCPPGHTPADMSAFAGATTRRSFNTMSGSNAGRSSSSLGRGMVSSASVCDLNSLAAQQQTQHGFNNSHAAGSFQQLNMMGYNNGMMWGAPAPAPPCDLCQSTTSYPGHSSSSGMKRTASNLSMNLSSVGSDVSSYPWGPAPPPHVHHHMPPPMYPMYYPGYHPHMGPHPMGGGMGLNVSIPDSMHTFGKVPSSPAPSVRSSSHRSHKSSKSRSFSAADTSGRSSRAARRAKRSEESEESRSSSVSDDDINDHDRPAHVSSVAWQCDHCTFINSGGARTCGMCSKTVGSSSSRSNRRGSERRRYSDKRRDRRTDHEDDNRDISDYDNDDGVVKSNLSFNIKDSKRENRSKLSGSNRSKSKKKSRRRGSSVSNSESGSDGGGEEEERLERHMKDLRLSSSSSRRRGNDYDEKDRDRERSSRKKEGSGRFKNRGKNVSERSRTPGRQTPGRQTPRRASPVDDDASREDSSDPNPPEFINGLSASNDNHNENSLDGTVVNTIASEGTAVKSQSKSKSDSKEKDKSKREKKESSPKALPGQQEKISEQYHDQKENATKQNEDRLRANSPRLLPPQSPAPSNMTSNIDDPSFANTLDDIATMGTNEVADIDLSQFLDDIQQSSAEPQNIENEDAVPVLRYLGPKTQEEEIVEEQKPNTNEPLQAVKPNEDINNIEIQNVIPKDTGQSDKKPEISYSVYEPRYEPIEEPAQNEMPLPVEEKHESLNQEQPEQYYREETLGGSADKIHKINGSKQNSPLVSRGIEVARSASSGSSLGPGTPQDRDRQYTSLSCSSSDAQFYSPPDSPDLSLSDQLKDVPATSHTQAFTVHQDSKPTNSQTLKNRDDLVTALETDYLVTALETMQTAQTGEDLKSSRETIRSSLEQLPYSNEGSEDEKEKKKEQPQRPASAGAAPVPPSSLPLAPVTADNYDNYYFQDALTPSSAAKLLRSNSAKDLLLSSSIVGSGTQSSEMSSGLVSLQEEADREALSAAWSKEELNEKFMTVEEIINKRRQKVMETQGLQLVQILRDAEDAGYTSEEVSIALTHCGDKSPLEWLKENWKHMVDTVLTLATNYGHERKVNDVGAISPQEARMALRIHKGNIWASVTECVEQRQKKFTDIDSRGKFKREDIVKALEKHNGDVESAFKEVNKSHMQPVISKIWGSLSSTVAEHVNKRKKDPSATPAGSSGVPTKVETSSIPKPAPPPPPPPFTVKGMSAHKEQSPATQSTDVKKAYSRAQLPQPDKQPMKESTSMKFSPDSTQPQLAQQKSLPRQYQQEEKQQKQQQQNSTQKKNRKYSSTLHVSLSNQRHVPHSTEKRQRNVAQQKTVPDLPSPDGYESIATPFEERERIAATTNEIISTPVAESEKESAPSSARSSLLLEDYEASDEEESVSVTTGRLSLSLNAESINVKSEVIQTEQVPATEHDQDTERDNLSDAEKRRYENQSIAEAEEAVSAEERKSEGENDDEQNVQRNEIRTLDEPGMAQTKTGPVTVQKASALLGKAIAKAMKRETVARESQSRSVTPEVPEVTLTTPEPSEEEEDTAGQTTVSESDEDDMRMLDTIPEEDEISERTESRVSKSASKKLQLKSSLSKGGSAAEAAKSNSTASTSRNNKTVEAPNSYYNANQKNTYYNGSEAENTNNTKNYYNQSKFNKNYYNESAAGEAKGNTNNNVKLDEYDSVAVKTDNEKSNRATPITTKKKQNGVTSEVYETTSSATHDPDETYVTNPSLYLDLDDVTVPSTSIDLDAFNSKTYGTEATGITETKTSSLYQDTDKSYATNPSLYLDLNDITVPSASIDLDAFASKSEDKEVTDTNVTKSSVTQDNDKTYATNTSLYLDLDDITIPSASIDLDAFASKTEATRGDKNTVTKSSIAQDPDPTYATNTSLYLDLNDITVPSESINLDAFDSTYVTSPTIDLEKDAEDDDEVIYYDEVILKTDVSESGKSAATTSNRRKRRRRKKNRSGNAGASRAGSSAAGSVPASSVPTPSPTPASNSPGEATPKTESSTPTTIKEISVTAEASNTKEETKKTKSNDNRIYAFIEKVKAPFTKSAKADAAASSSTSQRKGSTSSASNPVEEDNQDKKDDTQAEKTGQQQDNQDKSQKEMVSQEPLKVPNLLVQIEDLKARYGREPDYQEVKELKEQIQMMRKQLEARMEEEEGDDDDADGRSITPETPQEEIKEPVFSQESPTVEKPSKEYEQLKFDRTVRRLLAEGHANTYEKAELAAQLMTFSFLEEDCIHAAGECSSMYTAIQFLQQECELCAEKYPMGKMVSMLHCIHRCCHECAKTYFTFQIKTKNIRDLRCPFCNEPDLDECEEIANEYLNNMDILLKNILDEETHELFQRKLRDWTLMKDPNFRWCNKCSSGFIANPRARKLICPDCKDVTCAQCRVPWEAAHEGISCIAFERWKTDNDPETNLQGVARHLAECGITCPKCKFTYSLAKGGCMHFTCTQCKFEFCSGCGQPFKQGSRCKVGPYCERLGLHAHHPRNCLFYLRDKDPHELQKLLKDAGISYDTESAQEENLAPGKRPHCAVQEQKELADGLKDDSCGRPVPKGFAGLCKLHYTEYLVEKINTHKLDPVSIFDEADLRVCLRRNGKPVPVRRWESEKLYRDKLIKLIKEHLPLDAVEQ